MHVRTPVSILLLFSGLGACHSTPGAPAEHGYTLVLIQTGPESGKLSKEENDRAFAGHFANMGRMAEARQLVVAGPYGEKRHDPNLRGLFVLDSAERAVAETWAHTDPTTQAGVFQLEFHDLATDAPLQRALEDDLAWRAREKAEGKTPQPGEGARPYVLLTAEHGDLARRELGPLLSTEGGVYLFASLDGTRALALLDAPDIAEARERFGPQLENLGAYALDEWFASNQLARLVEVR